MKKDRFDATPSNRVRLMRERIVGSQKKAREMRQLSKIGEDETRGYGFMEQVRGALDTLYLHTARPFESLSDFIAQAPLTQDSPALSDFYNNIHKLYFLSEFINVSSEKLKSKTAFQGIVNDICHISFGLRCNCFITEDDALYKKAVFINDWMKRNPNVFKIDDFIKYSLNIFSKVYMKNFKKEEEEELIFTFNKDNGNLIKEYAIRLTD